MVLYFLFFLSGAAALLFETLWFRLASLVFGNSVWASSLVLASFMAGLATGSWAAARRGPRLANPVRAYAILEAGVAATGLLLVWLLPHLTGVLTPLFRALVERPLALHAVRLSVAFLLMLVPSAAMGATLPLLVKARARAGAPFGPALGALYGWNTLGAMAGALAGEWLLMDLLGLAGTGVAAALLNLTAALLAWRLARRATGPAIPAGGVAEAVSVPRTAQVAFLLSAALCGGLVLALEVVWFRLLAPYMYASSPVFAVMLAVVLAGIAAGGWAAAAWLRADARAGEWAPGVALLAGAATLFTYGLLDRWLGPDPVHSLTLRAAAVRAFPLIFPTSFLSGLLFTFVGRGLLGEGGDEAKAAGWLTVSNTLGSMAGALAGGFLLLPRWGVELSLRGLGIAYAAVALALLAAANRRRGQVALVAAALAFVPALLQFPLGLMERGYLQRVVRRFGGDGSRPVAWRETLTETLLYMRQDLAGRPLGYRLVTNGYSMAGSSSANRRYMKDFVYWPIAFHPRPRRALLVSFGVGATAAALVDSAELDAIDVVDISKDVLEMGRLITPPGRGYPLDDPRVRVHVEDGRFFLMTARHGYDLITGEPPPPKFAGIVNLYTREYFGLVRARLAAGGITTYWLPVHQLTLHDSRAIVRAFCDVFEDCSLWNGGGLNWMLVGSNAAAYTPSPERLQRQWSDPVVGPELRALGFESPEMLAASFLGDAAFLSEWTRGVPPVVDDAPHRLSPRFIDLRDAAREHAAVLNGPAAWARFQASPLVARLLPAALRAQAGPAFEEQARLDRMSLRAYGLEVPGQWADLQESLRADSLYTRLSLLGTDPDAQAVAAEARAAGTSSSGLTYLQALGAGAAHDFATAERLLAEVQARNPAVALIVKQRALFLCAGGRAAEAHDVLRRWSGTAGGAALEPGFVAWAARSCPGSGQAGGGRAR
jgi:spermidine synthase